MTLNSLIVVATLLAQEAPQPPKPDNRPSLEVTMKFIQDKLNGQGMVVFSSKYQSSIEVWEAKADPASCMLSYVEDSILTSKITLSFREVEKLNVAKVYDVYWLSIDMLPDKMVRSIRGEIKNQRFKPDKSKKDWRSVSKSTRLAFSEEGLANRVAKAMLHAVELCGGGKKDPDPF